MKFLRSEILKKIVLVLLPLLFVVTFTACEDEDSESVKSYLVTGKWSSEYSDGVYFDTDNDKFVYAADYVGNNDGIIDWESEIVTAGVIEQHSDYDLESGYLVIKVTDDNGFVTYGVNKYIVIRWQEANGETLRESTASNYGTSLVAAYDSADEALLNMSESSGYFSVYATYSK